MNIPLTIGFNVLDMKKDKEYLCLTIQSNVPFYDYHNNPNVKDIDKRIPFIYSKIDDIEDDELVSFPFNSEIYNCQIISNNIICDEISLYGPNRIYRIYSDISKFKELSDKIYSLDYKLIVTYVTKYQFLFITLKYKPNMRKVKILKLIEKIKEKNVI